MHIRHKRKHRGLGNVIASMVFIFLMIFMTGNLMVWSILQFSDYQTVVQEMNSYDMLSIGEVISISGAKLDSSNYLDLTVSNNGRSTAHIVSLWIINETSLDADAKQYYFVQNEFINTGQSVSGIGSSVKLNSTMRYTFRIVTELGNIASYQLIPVTEAILKVDLTINPPTIISEHDLFVHMVVTNNLSITGSVYNIWPDLLPYEVLNLTSTATCGAPTPLSVDSLPAGSTAIFDWLCTIDGDSGSSIQFNASYVGAPVGVWDTDRVLIVTGGGRSNSTSYAAVAGDIFMNYKSIRWAERDPKLGPFSSWFDTWQIDKLTDLIFKVDVTNRGVEDLSLSEETCLFLIQLDDQGANSVLKALYLVSESGGTISTYNEDIILQVGMTTTLFFAVADSGQNPNVGGSLVDFKNNEDGVYNAVLTIFAINPNYGQSIPFQAFIVV